MGRQVRRKRRDLVAVAAAHDVTNLRVFGSVARGEDQPGSDVDLLVDLPPNMGLLDLPGTVLQATVDSANALADHWRNMDIRSDPIPRIAR